MIKRLFLLFFLTHFSALSFDFKDVFPDAQFVGHGAWQDNFGYYDEYDVYLEFFGNTFRSDYAYFGGGLTIQLGFLFINDLGEFDVVYNGLVAGAGACLEDECTYFYIDEAGVRNEERIWFSDVTLLRTGFKVIADRIVRWEEVLDRAVPIPPPLEPAPPYEDPYEDNDPSQTPKQES